MLRFRHKPMVLAAGFLAGLAASATACALLGSAAPVVKAAPVREAAPAVAAAPTTAERRDPFAPLVDVPAATLRRSGIDTN